MDVAGGGGGWISLGELGSRCHWGGWISQSVIIVPLKAFCCLILINGTAKKTVHFPSAPCQFGGTCTNTPGSFTCDCLPGYTGHLCQYTTVCETQTPCQTGLTCVETVTNTDGYVCENVSTSGSLVVTNPSTPPSTLDDLINTMQETQEVSLSVCLSVT